MSRQIEIEEGWEVVGGAVNGGYLLARLAMAAAAEVPHPDPVTVTGHYLGPGRSGTATVEVTVHKVGAGHSTAGARLVQEGRPVLALLATFGDLTRVPDEDESTVAVPPVDESRPLTREEFAAAPEIVDRVSLRLDEECTGFLRGERGGRPEMAGWVRLDAATLPPAFRLLVAADAFPPTLFGLGEFGWVPTVELTVHCRRRPPEGWLRGEFRTRYVTGPYLEEDGELRDPRGRLLALSRQLALRPRGASPTAPR